jgi:hypothetical protein
MLITRTLLNSSLWQSLARFHLDLYENELRASLRFFLIRPQVMLRIHEQYR